MNSWRVILATMVIFGTGVVTGGLLVHHVAPVRPTRAPHGPNAARQPQTTSPGGMRLDLLRRMAQELGLTPEQQEHIDKILRQSQEHSKKIMDPVRPQLVEEVEKTKQAFREVLTPEQQKRFDELLKQQQRPRELRRPGSSHERPEKAGVSTNS